ncbi:MAG: YigZ family protein [Chitinophagales bacterium]
MKTLYYYFNLSKASEGYFEDSVQNFMHTPTMFIRKNDKKILRKTKKNNNPKATHHCYAYRIGTDKNNFRANDDGEPSGSGRKTYFRQIDSFNLSNVLCVVVRF